MFTAIASRGEWSMSKILDIYFQFAMGSDYYLGQLLSLKDCNHESFDVLCPHWHDPTHPTVLAGIPLVSGRILSVHGESPRDPTSVFSLLLASMVHHSPWMLCIIEKDPSHPFSSIPLMFSPLLQVLYENHVTQDPNKHVQRVTGIPPFVQHQLAIKDVMSEVNRNGPKVVLAGKLCTFTSYLPPEST